jgi:hypothetical protein
MSIDREDVKHGIDTAAEKLKDVTDKVAAKFDKASDEASKKTREMARKTGDVMIDKGQKLKAAAREPSDPAREN